MNYIDPTGHSAVARYVGAGLAVGIGLLGLLFTAPTAGASLGVSATAANVAGLLFTASGIVSAGLLLGSQAALNSGNKAVAKALDIASGAVGALGLVDLAVATAPKLAEMATQWIAKNVGGSAAIEEAASEVALLPDSVATSAESQTEKGEGALSATSSPTNANVEEFGAFASRPCSEWQQIDFYEHLNNHMVNAEEAKLTINNLSKIIGTNFPDFKGDKERLLFAFSTNLLPKKMTADDVLKMLRAFKTNTVFSYKDMEYFHYFANNLSFKGSADEVRKGIRWYAGEIYTN